MIETTSLGGESKQYLLFKLGDNLYGVPLLDVLEVTEARCINPVPNTAPGFLGVVNLRGRIAGVFDLRKRFGNGPRRGGNEVLLVFETEGGLLAGLVDGIDSVACIPRQQINTAPPIRTDVSARFFLGVGQHDDRLVSILDLARILQSEELACRKS